MLVFGLVALLQMVGAQVNSVFAKEEVQTIVFDCGVFVDGKKILDGDTISVFIPGIKTLYNEGKLIYQYDSINKIELQYDSANPLFQYKDELEFSFISGRAGCVSTLIEYSVNVDSSTEYTLVIDSFTISTYQYKYEHAVYCASNEKVFPVTNLPPNSYVIRPYPLMPMDSVGGFTSEGVGAGMYTVHVNTDYCVTQNYFGDTIRIEIKEGVQPDLNDTILFCQDVNVIGELSGYQIYTGGDTLINSAQGDIEKSGFYHLKFKEQVACSRADTVYINIIPPIPVTFKVEEHCDYKEISLTSKLSGDEKITWSDNSTGSIVKVTAGSSISSLEIVDQYGCATVEPVNVSFQPFAVKSFEYDIKDADCWSDAEFAIKQLSVTHPKRPYVARLVNTIDGTETKVDRQKLPAGIYKFYLVDDKGCEISYGQPITIEENCLNDFPVFSPTLEEHYFIPHDGTIKIFDRTGKLLQELFTPGYWDGTDSQGNILPMGSYVMVTEDGKAISITIIR